MKLRLVLLGLALSSSLVVAAEEPPERSLAERAEAARQKKAANGPSKVLTNKDLRNAKGTVIVLPEPEPKPSPSPVASPSAASAPSPAPSPSPAAASATPVPSDPAEVQAQLQELEGRVARYRKAMQDADAELRAGGALSSERRAVLTKFLEDGRREVAQAEQAMAELKARVPGAVARP